MSTPPADRELGHRAFALVLVGMAAAVWWPAFTLGAWGALFFDQLLTVWVVATAALVVVLVQPNGVGRRWPRVIALLVPSLWLFLAFFDDGAGTDGYSALVDVTGTIVGLVGIPFTLWTLVRVLWPELFNQLRPRARIAVIATVVLIAVASLALGVFQDRFLTCQDFEISGNSDPPGCVQETPAALTSR